MENELVKRVKENCRELYNDIQTRFETLRSEGASEEILSELRNDAQRCIDIYLSTNVENFEDKNNDLLLLRREVVFDPEEEEEAEEEPVEEPTDEEEPVENPEEEEETEVDKKSSGVIRGIAAALGLVSLGGIAYHTGRLVASDKSDKTEVVEESENDKLILDIENITIYFFFYKIIYKF